MLSFSEIERILNDINIPPYSFRLTENIHGEIFLQAIMWRENVNNGEWEWGRGGKNYVSRFSAINEILQMAFGACKAFSEHEIRDFTCLNPSGVDHCINSLVLLVELDYLGCSRSIELFFVLSFCTYHDDERSLRKAYPNT